MNQNEFNILVTNVSAIANQTFSIQCGNFANAIAADNQHELSTKPFEAEAHISKFNFQEVIDSGYSQLNELSEELENAWNLIDRNTLQASLELLPGEYSNLTQKLSGSQLKQWIIHTLKSEDDSAFYTVHRIIMALFQSDDEIRDLIREAIAFNELTDISREEKNIRAEHIQVTDLVAAATIQSFDVFDWLIQRSDLDDAMMLKLLGDCIDDITVFKHIYKTVSLSNTQYDDILKLAQAQGESPIVYFLTGHN